MRRPASESLKVDGAKKGGWSCDQPPASLNDQRSCSHCTWTLACLAVLVNQEAIPSGRRKVVSVPAFTGYGEHKLHSLSPQQLAHVREVGLALFQGRGLQAEHGGLINVLDPKPLQDTKGNIDGTGQEFQRSEAGTRQRRQGSPGGSRQPWRPSDPHGTVLHRAFLSAEAPAALRQHYTGVKRWKELGGKGVWLAVSVFPVGMEGPQADFIIAVPRNPTFRIVAWGFWRMKDGPIWMGPKHTNYPDGSSCAFPVNSGVWTEDHGITAYVDRLAEWSMRHLYLDAEGLWPGPQEGDHIYYRLRHTHPRECCTRCWQLEPYQSCCQALDQKESAAGDREDFIALIWLRRCRATPALSTAQMDGAYARRSPFHESDSPEPPSYKRVSLRER